MTDSKEQLNALMSDIAQRANICKNAAIALVAVGAASVHCHVPVPIPTGEMRERRRVKVCLLTVVAVTIVRLYSVGNVLFEANMQNTSIMHVTITMG